MRFFNKISLILIVVVFFTDNSYGQCYTKDSIVLHFRFNNISIDRDYMNNHSSIKKLDDILINYNIDSISITSGSSLEGAFEYNILLSEHRADVVKDYIISRYPNANKYKITTYSKGEDWDGLYYMLYKAPSFLHKQDILNIIRDDSIKSINKKELIKALDSGCTWRIITNKYFRYLREAKCIIFITDKAQDDSDIPTNTLELISQDTILNNDSINDVTTLLSADLEPRLRRKTIFALKSNLIYDLAITPNIGIELTLPHNWSVGANWMYAWWKNDSRHRYWRIYGGELNVRKYISNKYEPNNLLGHHLGLLLQAGTYDFEFGGKGELSPLACGASLEYGYSIPIAKKLNIDFEIALGFIAGKYKEYTPVDNCYVWEATKRRVYWGPTKLGVTLVWLINK